MKRRLCLTGILLALSLLGGCGTIAAERSTANAGISSLWGTATGGQPTYTSVLDNLFSTQRPNVEASTVEPELDTPLYADTEPVILWGREQLSAEARISYDVLSSAIAARQDTVQMAGDVVDMDAVMEAIRIDHPEFFWFDGEISFVTTTMGDVSLYTECSFSYTMDRAQIQEAHGKIQQYSAACLSSLENMGAATDYEKILGVYRYIITHTDYVTSETDQSIYSVMSRGEGVCAGYARSFQYLMNQLGIPCTLALGSGPSGESHGWNIVQCDGSWYQLDVTWGDPVDADGFPGNALRYTYCLITDEEMYRDHALDMAFSMPVCSNNTYNYFIREGLQMDYWDRDIYTEKMRSAVESGVSEFSVRFSTGEAYEDALYALFKAGEIWDCLEDCGLREPGDAQVAYGQDDLFTIISVQLS